MIKYALVTMSLQVHGFIIELLGYLICELKNIMYLEFGAVRGLRHLSGSWEAGLCERWLCGGIEGLKGQRQSSCWGAGDPKTKGKAPA